MFRKTKNDIQELRFKMLNNSDRIIEANQRITKTSEQATEDINVLHKRLDVYADRINSIGRQKVKARARANSRDDHKVIPKHHTETYSRKYYITLECVCGFVYMTEPHRIEVQAREEANAATQLHEEGVL